MVLPPKMTAGLSADIPILMYHHLEPDGVLLSPYAITAGLFSAQLEILQRRGFTTLTFQELFAALNAKCALPARAVIITFDDAYESFREFALPALVAHGMTATVFVVAGKIGGINHWDLPQGYPRRALMGDVALKEIIAAADEKVTRWMVVELDRCDTDMFEAVEQSYKYLISNKLASGNK